MTHTTLPIRSEVCGSAFSGKSALCQVCKGSFVALELLAGLVSKPLLCRNPGVLVDQLTSWFLNVSQGHG